MSRLTGGRPFARDVARRIHRRRSHVRCQPTTVSGRTSTIADRQFVQMRRKAIQNRRSRACKSGRPFARFIAISCCRSARFSRTRSRCPRSPNASARPTTINSWSMSRSWLARTRESTRTSCGEGHRTADCSRRRPRTGERRAVNGCGLDTSIVGSPVERQGEPQFADPVPFLRESGAKDGGPDLSQLEPTDQLDAPGRGFPESRIRRFADCRSPPATFVFPRKSARLNHFLDRPTWLRLAPEAQVWELVGTNLRGSQPAVLRSEERRANCCALASVCGHANALSRDGSRLRHSRPTRGASIAPSPAVIQGPHPS